MALTAKQRRFVAEYLVDLNATQAAIRCGYSPRTAKQQGARLLTNADVTHAVAVGQAKQLDRADVRAARVLEELRRIAFTDARAFFHADGRLRPITDLTEEQGSQLAGLEVIIKNAEAGDGHTDKVHKFKFWDKVRALEALAKHFGLLTERLEVSGWDKISAQLNHARTVGPTAST